MVPPAGIMKEQPSVAVVAARGGFLVAPGSIRSATVSVGRTYSHCHGHDD